MSMHDILSRWFRRPQRSAVSPRSARGTQLGLESLEGRNLLTALPYGDILPGVIGGSGQSAFAEFTFNAHAGELFTLALTSTATQAGFAAFANVYAPSGTHIDNFFATGQRYINADENGEYSVRIHDSDFAQSGEFTLGLEGITPVSPNPTPLVPGGIVGGSIDAPIDVKQFTFAGTAGDVISLAMTSTATQSGFAAFANVFAPSGTHIDNFFSTGQRYLTLPETGVYLVQMHDSDYGQKGSFKIGLEGISPRSPNPGALLPGGIISGSIDAPIDVKQYTFSGSKGDVISLAMTSTATQSGFAAFANVFAPSGTHIDNFFATGQRYLTLEETGTFMVQMHDSDYGQKGSFTIGLEGINPISPAPKPLVWGGFVSGTISAPIDVKQFTFTARAGAVIGLSLTSTATQAGFAAFANVYAPSGTHIDNFFRTGLRYLKLEETGTYMVQLHDSDYAQKGAFKIGLEGISPPMRSTPRLAARRTYSGTIGQSNDVAQYLLSARANTAVRITLTSRATQPGFAAFVDIFDAAGNWQTSFFAGTRTFVVPVTGTYLIQVHDSDLRQTGTFTLRIG